MSVTSRLFRLVLVVCLVLSGTVFTGGSAAATEDSDTAFDLLESAKKKKEPATPKPFVCPTTGPIRISVSPARKAKNLKAMSSSAKPAPAVSGRNRPHPGYSGVVGALEPSTRVVVPQAAPPKRVAEGISPLTGKKSKKADLPAVVVKISNSPQAQPQTGLHKADLVVEEQVEGGITRFLAIYQSQTALVGPVRSVRSTDIAVVNSLRTPAMMYSGGNRTFVRLIRDQNIVDVSEATCPKSFRRVAGKIAPHNLYSRTGSIAKALDSEPPRTQFRFRKRNEKVGGVKAKRAQVTYTANLVDWQWHPKKQVWQRWQNNRPHVVSSGAQIAAQNVIIAEIDRVDSGLRDSVGSVVTEDVFVGKGRAVILTKGRAILARWNRPSLDLPATFIDRKTRKPIFITPGNTWIQLAETGEYDFE